MPPANQPPADRGLDPQALLAIRDLELRARVVVEGLWAGLHRSPFSGFSVEFTEYRQYSPGDDLRFLDWRVLARTDREYVRKFEDETNLRCQLLIDHSRSMEFGSRDFSKADYARTLAASIGYFLLQQRDMVGLAMFADGLANYLPARWRPGHLRRLLGILDTPFEVGATRIGAALQDVARLWRKRSLVVIISDLLSPVEEWDESLGHLVAAGHDVRIIQVLDPVELTLDYGKPAVWEDLESGRQLFLDPKQAGKAYREKFDAHQANVRTVLERRGVPHQVARTDTPFDFVLLEWIQRSGAHGISASRSRKARK
jgi:uncharacterized protein (DUF58 family)